MLGRSLAGEHLTASTRTLLLVSGLGLALLAGACSSSGQGGPTTAPSPGEAALPFSESFDAGTAGGEVTSDNSVFNVIENAPATFESTPTPVDGGLVGRYASSGENIRTKVEFSDEEVTTLYERAYLWINSYPSAVMRFLTFETSPDAEPPGEDVVALRLDRRGYLQVYNGKAFVKANFSEVTLPLGEWVRLEIGYDATSGTYGQSIVRIFLGDNVDGLEPDETLTVGHVEAPSNPVTTAAFGVLNLVEVDFSLDAIAADREAWVGPAPS